jgi:hypothetical protein
MGPSFGKGNRDFADVQSSVQIEHWAMKRSGTVGSPIAGDGNDSVLPLRARKLT